MAIRIVLILILFIGCQQDEDMRLFMSSLSNQQTEIPFNEFSQAITVEPIVMEEHRAFPAIVQIGEVIHLFYRLGHTHVSVDGVIMTKSSSDYGETWTDEVEIYDGTHLLTDYPEIIEDNPNNVPDCRDPKAELMDDGTLLLLPFVSVGVAPALEERDLFRIYATRIKIPIIDGVPQYQSATNYSISLVRNAISFGTLYKDGVLYYGLYDRSVTVYKSIDDGVSVSIIGEAFPYPDTADTDMVNEHDFYFNGTKLICVGRPLEGGESGKLTASLDYGVTWGAITDAPKRIDGMEALDLGYGRAVIAGRNNDSQKNTQLYTLNDEVGEQSPFEVFSGLEGGGDGLGDDRGYASIIRHPNGKIFIASYHGIRNEEPLSTSHSSVGIFFRQLNYDEITHLISFGND